MYVWGKGPFLFPQLFPSFLGSFSPFPLFITLWLIYKHFCPFHSFCEDLLQIHYLCSKAADKRQFRYFIECKRNELQCELVGVVRLYILCKFCKTHYRRRGNIYTDNSVDLWDYLQPPQLEHNLLEIMLQQLFIDAKWGKIWHSDIVSQCSEVSTLQVWSNLQQQDHFLSSHQLLPQLTYLVKFYI